MVPSWMIEPYRALSAPFVPVLQSLAALPTDSNSQYSLVEMHVVLGVGQSHHTVVNSSSETPVPAPTTVDWTATASVVSISW